MNKENASGLLKLPITTLQQCCKQHYYSTDSKSESWKRSVCFSHSVCFVGLQNRPNFHPSPGAASSFKFTEKKYKTSEPLNDEIWLILKKELLLCFQFKIKCFTFSWTGILGTENRFSLFKEVS